MKGLKILFLLYTFSLSASCLAQDLTKEKEVKNLLSIVAGGTSTTFGITYEHILYRKASLEIGIGLLGGGFGMNFYPFKSFDIKQFNPFIGVRSSYNIQGSGGSRIVNYVPIGINYFGLKKLYLSVDFGPAYIVQLAPNGKTIPEFQSNYPRHLFYVYGGFKVGFGF